MFDIKTSKRGFVNDNLMFLVQGWVKGTAGNFIVILKWLIDHFLKSFMITFAQHKLTQNIWTIVSKLNRPGLKMELNSRSKSNSMTFTFHLDVKITTLL